MKLENLVFYQLAKYQSGKLSTKPYELISYTSQGIKMFHSPLGNNNILFYQPYTSMPQLHNKKAYFLGKNLGTLLAAYYLVKYCEFQPYNITIYDNKPVQQYIFSSINYIDDLALYFNGRVTNIRLDDMESLVCQKTSLNINYQQHTYQRPLFNGYKDYLKKKKQEFEVQQHQYETNAYKQKHIMIKSRIIDQNGVRIDLKSMGLNIRQQKQLIVFLFKSNKQLSSTKINDWFDQTFFKTKLWLVWSSAFYFQPWHSALEFRKYIRQLIHQYHRVVLLNDFKITPYNQIKYLIDPTVTYLEKLGVKFVTNTICTNINIDDFDHQIALKSFKVQYISLEYYKDQSIDQLLQCYHKDEEAFVNKIIANVQTIQLQSSDIVFIQNGSVLDGITFGTHEMAPILKLRMNWYSSPNFMLWKQLSNLNDKVFGNSLNFTKNISETLLATFQIEINSLELFHYISTFQNTSHNNVSVITFKDSNWQITLYIFQQPITLNQPKDKYFIWGSALSPTKIGNYEEYEMINCTGAQVFYEIAQHMRIPPRFYDKAQCILSILPYGTAPLQAGQFNSKPEIVPEQVSNIGLTSHFVKLPNQLAYTIEGLIKSASLSVQRLNKVILHVPDLQRQDNKMNSKIKTFILGIKNSNYTEQQRGMYISEHNFQCIIAIIGTIIALVIGYSKLNE